MDKTERIGVSLDSNLLASFDALIARKAYPNRSEAFRDLIRENLCREQLADPNTMAVAGVFLVYDHHASGVNQKLTHLQHNSFLKTICTMHVHLSHDDCLEIIVLRGRAGEIEKLANQFISLKGVKLGKVNLLAVSDEHDDEHHHKHHHHE
ncbi:MAG: nickel-responsive transcriptional regulator NikR [Sedimentisphaerales bacterium]|nr:nickel-responsive transcriptional regulator NikR [Sedimentisphaerales bacterium]